MVWTYSASEGCAAAVNKAASGVGGFGFTLPPYDVLDPILEAYVEEDRSIDEIVAAGFDEATVKRVVKMVDRNEYKRRQAPPGLKVTPRAFGRDRRLPIANRYDPS